MESGVTVWKDKIQTKIGGKRGINHSTEWFQRKYVHTEAGECSASLGNGGMPDGITITDFVFATHTYWRPTWAVIQASGSLSLGRQFCQKRTALTRTSYALSVSMWGMSLQQEGAYSKKERPRCCIMGSGISYLQSQRNLAWLSEAHSRFCSALFPCAGCYLE